MLYLKKFSSVMGIYNRGELSFSRLITLFREKRLLIRKLFANQISNE